MKKILEIYALAVCFVSVFIAAIVLVIGSYDIIKIFNPALTLSTYKYENSQSNDSFCRTQPPKTCDKKTDTEITKMRQATYLRELSNEKRDGYQGLIFEFIFLIVSIILFFSHWILSKNSRRNTP